MAKKKKPSPEANTDNNKSEDNSSRTRIIVAIIAVIGVALAAYLKYIGDKTQVQIPIWATQTAEAKLGLTVSTITPPPSMASVLPLNSTSSPTPMPPMIIADFDDCLHRTKPGGITGVTSYQPDDIQVTYSHDTKPGCSAKLKYHIEKNFVTFYLKLAGADLTGYSTLSFDLRGDSQIGVPDKIKVELKRLNKTEVAYKYISEISDQWQTFSLPLEDFLPLHLTSYTDMTELVFTFEPNQAVLDGAVYLDNIVAGVQ
jgi:hypothetical protein